MTDREQYKAGPAIRDSRGKVTIIYWIFTILLASGMLAAGLEQVFHARRFVELFVHLRYPLYFLYILGAWQIAGVIAILIPGFRLLKEWAYAGVIFMYAGAAASHLLAGDAADIWPRPLMLALIAFASWKLRPDSRKLQPAISGSGKYERSRALWYWVTTVLTAFILISGGLWLISNSRLLADQNSSLGFPAYFWQILGVCKLLGGVAILTPALAVSKRMGLRRHCVQYDRRLSRACIYK